MLKKRLDKSNPIRAGGSPAYASNRLARTEMVRSNGNWADSSGRRNTIFVG